MDKVSRLLLKESVAAEIAALRKGIFEVLPPHLLRPFSVKDVLLMLQGLTDIDVDEWQQNTTYSGYQSSDPVRKRFYRRLIPASCDAMIGMGV